MHWGFVAEQAHIVLLRATGQISAAEELCMMQDLLARMQRRNLVLGIIASVFPVVVVGGLALLAMRLCGVS